MTGPGARPPYPRPPPTCPPPKNSSYPGLAPISGATPQETDQLFEYPSNAAATWRDGDLISHKLREIMAVTRSVYVMRHGEMVTQLQDVRKTTREELAELRSGRKYSLAGQTLPQPAARLQSLRESRCATRAAFTVLEPYIITLRRAYRRDRVASPATASRACSRARRHQPPYPPAVSCGRLEITVGAPADPAEC